jgi:hypothetical protein
MNHQRNPSMILLIMGIVLLLISGSQWFEYATQNDQIWWTPKELAENLDRSRDRVEIFVRDILLQDALDSGSLFIRTDSGVTQLTRDDFTFRFNNWDRVRASWNSRIALDTAFTLIALLFVVFGLISYSHRPDKPPASAQP